MGRLPMKSLTAGSLASDRMAALHGVRFAAGVTTTLTLLAFPRLYAAGWPAVPVLLAWLAVTTIAEVLRRSSRVEPGWPVSAMLALDVLVLGALLAHSGGFQSPLMSLVYLHVVAVSLLLSHRVALRVAVWHGVTLVTTFVLASSERWSRLRLPTGTSLADGARLAPVHAGGFLVVAVGLAFFSAVNEHLIRRTHRDLGLLAEVGKALGASATSEDTLPATATLVREWLDADAVAVAVAEAGTCHAVRVDRLATSFLTASNAPGVAVGDLRETELVYSLATLDDRLEALLPDESNVVTVPFVVDAQTTGFVLVALGGGRRRRLPETTVRILEQVSRLVASACERARLHAQLERLAAFDALTSLVNRRTFDEALNRELERARRTGESVSLVVLDIDHFKRVNDTHGHAMGDAVLRHFGRELALAARESDLPARFGGEEFVVLLTACDAGDALEAADRLRRASVSGDCPLPITASAGVATFPAQARDAASLFAAADAALYAAKEGGRDRVVSSVATARPRLVALAG